MVGCGGNSDINIEFNPIFISDTTRPTEISTENSEFGMDNIIYAKVEKDDVSNFSRVSNKRPIEFFFWVPCRISIRDYCF